MDNLPRGDACAGPWAIFNGQVLRYPPSMQLAEAPALRIPRGQIATSKYRATTYILILAPACERSARQLAPHWGFTSGGPS
jgi:hypothetical protein